MADDFDPDAYLAGKGTDVAAPSSTAPFDPDAYLNSKTQSPVFDPDAYLKSNGVDAPKVDLLGGDIQTYPSESDQRGLIDAQQSVFKSAQVAQQAQRKEDFDALPAVMKDFVAPIALAGKDIVRTAAPIAGWIGAKDVEDNLRKAANDPAGQGLEENLGGVTKGLTRAGELYTLGLPGAVLKSSIDSYDQKLQETGDAKQAAIYTLKTAPEIAAYMLVGKYFRPLAPLLKDESAAFQGIAGAGQSSLANVITSYAIRTIESGDIKNALPNQESLAQDVFFGVLHGAHEGMKIAADESKMKEALKSAPDALLQQAQADPKIAETIPKLPELVNQEINRRQQTNLEDSGLTKTAEAVKLSNEPSPQKTEESTASAPDTKGAVDAERDQTGVATAAEPAQPLEVKNSSGETQTVPSPEGVDTTKPHIVSTAVEQDGQVHVLEGKPAAGHEVIGTLHDTLPDQPEQGQRGFIIDDGNGNQTFTDDKVKAGEIADASGQRTDESKGEPLQSQDLTTSRKQFQQRELSPDEQAERQAEDEHKKDLISQGDLSDTHEELLDAVRREGGLPSQDHPHDSSEVAQVREAYQNRSKGAFNTGEKIKQIFSKSANSPDDLRHALAQHGFKFDTENEMMDAIKDRINSGKKQFGTQQEELPQYAVGAMRKGELPPQEVTGLKKATVKDERLARGLDDLPKAERQDEGDKVRRAEDKSVADPETGRKLVSKILESGVKSITSDEAADLLVERNRVMNKRRDLEKEFYNEETTPERKKEVTSKLNDLENQLNRLDSAQRIAGSEWGRTGSMYQQLIKEDYTLESLESRARIANGKGLEPDERAKIKDLSEKLEEAQKRVESSEGVDAQLKEQQALTDTYKATVDNLKSQEAARPKYGKEVFDIARKIVDRWKADAEQAHKNLRASLGRTSAGVDPTILLDVAKIVRAKIGELGVDYAENAAQLIAEYGEKVIPYIREAWKKAQQMIEKEKTSAKVKGVVKRGMRKTVEKTPVDIVGRAKAEATAGEELSHKTVYELARAHINAGIHGEDAVMKAVHSDIKEAYPDATERDVRRAFSEYGKVQFPNKAADLTELRELRNLTRMQESIDRLKANEEALKSGPQRDKATQAVREKQAELNELLKKRQGPPSAEKLASRDEAKQTALKNRIADLDKHLKTGEKPQKGSPIEDSPKTEQLRAERDAMQEKLNEIEKASKPQKSEAEKQIDKLSKIKQRLDETLSGALDKTAPKPFEALSNSAADMKAEIDSMRELAARLEREKKPAGDPNASKEKAQIKALHDSITEYERRINKSDFSPQEKGAPRPDSQAVSMMREIRDARKAVYDAAKKASQPVRTPEEIYNSTRQKAIAKQTAELQERIKKNDYTKTARPTTPAKNPETVQAWTALQKLKQEAKINEEKLRLSNRSAPQRAVDALKSAFHLPSAIKVFGHGTVGMFTHAGALSFRPSVADIFWRNFGKQFALWTKPEYYERAIYNLEKHPRFDFWKNSGAAIDPTKTYTDYGMYAKWLGKIEAAGTRGFAALKLARLELNERSWASLPDSIKKDSIASVEAAKYIAEMNNKATGAIGTKAIDKGNDRLNALARNPITDSILFAPKLYASRFSRVVIDPIKTAFTFADWNKATPAQRAVAVIRMTHAAEFAAVYTAAMITNRAILKATGSNQSVNMTDPTKSDWLKFKVGGKTITADAGLLDPVRLIGQIVWGDLIKKRTSNEQYKDGTLYQKVTNDLAEYVRGKLNPTLGLITDVATRSDFQGRPLPFSNEKPKYKDQPKYCWGEWLLNQGPIPLAGGSKIAYDEMRKRGMSSPQVMDFLKGAAVSLIGATGIHVIEDHPKKSGETITASHIK